MRLHRVAAGLVVLAIAFAGGTGLAIKYGDASPPPEMTSVSEPFKHVDFSALPRAQFHVARDGTRLAYREYPGSDPRRLVLMVHGSTGNGIGLHPLARAVSARGPTVWTLDMRGHGDSGRRGDIDYPEQLDDDTEDLAKAARATDPARKLTLLGFSAGGGYVLHAGAGRLAPQFERIVALAPYLGYDSGTTRKGEGVDRWAVPAVLRMIGLRIANAFGIHAYDGLPVIYYAISPQHAKNLAGTYSWRLQRAFGAGPDAFAELRALPHAPDVWIGDKDEMFDPAAMQSKVLAARPDAKITIVPAVNHIGLTVDPASTAAIAATF